MNRKQRLAGGDSIKLDFASVKGSEIFSVCKSLGELDNDETIGRYESKVKLKLFRQASMVSPVAPQHFIERNDCPNKLASDIDVVFVTDITYRRNNTWGGRALPAVLTLLSLSLAISAIPVQAFSSEDGAKVELLEKKLFFKAYSGESDEKRLARIERRYFGEETKSNPDDRLKKIFSAAGPLEKKQEPALGTPSSGSTPLTSSPTKRPTKSSFSDPDAAWETASAQAMQARDEEIRVMLKEAINLWKSKKVDESIKMFIQVIRIDPNNPEAHFSLGVVYESKGDYKKAAELYRKAHDINPDDMSYKRAIVTLEAKAKKQVVVDAKQNEMNALAREASAAFKRKEYMTAMDLYKRLDQQFPDKAVYKYNIGTLYLLMKDPAQALEYYKQAHKLEPKEKRYEEAFKKLEDSVEEQEDKRKKAEREWQKSEKERKKAGKKGGSRGPTQGRPGAAQRPTTPQDFLSSQGMIAAPAQGGVLVKGVGIGSRAAKAGLRGGDLIVGVDGMNLQNPGQLISILTRKRPGEKALLIVNRKGKIGQILF